MDFTLDGVFQLIGCFFELAESLAESAADFRETTGSKNDECDDEDEQKLRQTKGPEHDDRTFLPP